MFSQIWIIIYLNIRSLPKRFWSTLTTILSITIVVGLLLAFLAMANGFKKTLTAGGADDIVIITRAGSQSEINSVLLFDDVKLLETAPGIAKNGSQPIVSNELYVIVDGIKRTTQSKVNLALRGISNDGVNLRQGVELTAGRMFEPGKNEIIVGQSIIEQFSGFTIGNKMRFGKSEWTVVGIFTSVASAYTGELWTDYRDVQNQFQRGNSFSTMRAKLDSANGLEQLIQFANNDPRLNVDIKTEAAYFSEQGDALKSILFIGWVLGIIMAIGSLAGSLNTMYHSVSARSKDIATLRAIGYGSFPNFIGTMFESIFLALIGGVIGCIAAYLLFNGITTSTLGANFSQVVFSFQLTQQSILQALTLAFLIGLVGGITPALRAATLPVVTALGRG